MNRSFVLFLNPIRPHFEIVLGSSRRCNRLLLSSTLPKMSTFKLQEDVSVALPSGLAEEELRSFQPFNDWLKRLKAAIDLQSNRSHAFHAEPYGLRSIEVQSCDRRPDGSLLFVKMLAEIKNETGESIPGSIMLRGPSVVMLVVLRPDDVPADSEDTERWVVMVVQPRTPAGSLGFLELPAGMVDPGEGANVTGTAVREMKEEAGIDIGPHEFVNMSDLVLEGRDDNEEGLPRAIYLSVGLLDEHISSFLHSSVVSRERLNELKGKLTGLRAEGEKITLKLVPLKDVWREGSRDGKTLATMALFEGLWRENKIKLA